MVNGKSKRIFKSRIPSIILGILSGRLMYYIIIYSYETPGISPQAQGISKVIQRKIQAADFTECQILPFSFQTLDTLHKAEEITNGAWSKLETIPSTPKVHVITPTFRNPIQDAEIIRMYQALYPARHAIKWFIVDEYEKGSPEHIQRLQKLLQTFDKNMSITLLRSAKRSANFTKKHQFYGNPRGVDARRTAIQELRSKGAEGVVIFADDDNTYDSDLFGQIQNTHAITAWPVGCMTLVGLSSPIVDSESNVIGFHDGWIGGRKFPVDFAEFAVNLEYLHMYPDANIPYIVSYEETIFLEQLHLDMDLVIPLGSGGTKVLAYHTKTVIPSSKLGGKFSFDAKELRNTNLPDLWENLYSRK